MYKRQSLSNIHQICLITQSKLLRLVQEDIDAFNMVMECYADKGSYQYEKAIETAVTVSLNIMREASALADASEYLSKQGNKNLISDVAIGANLLSAGIESAYINVLVNLKTISNDLISRETKEQSRNYLQSSDRLTKIYRFIRDGLWEP